ncbi:MAG: hypothetical protein KatS3mg129_2318 [Leptospiraceae bacterium]|nr:MAG: hypothetical protein KatS3mg129_2318 [Leptospiraceae bacterium]
MGPIPAPDNNIPMEVLIPDEGVYYYVNGLNGSTEFVLNRYGRPLARYVYEPYGKINPYLTNLDLDRNQYFYKGKFYY